MIEVCSLSSGSNGNAFYIRTGSGSFLVDAGISCRQTCLRLEQVGSHISQIKAIFITHEHSDHIRGLRVLLGKYPIPVYLSEKTYAQSGLQLDSQLLHFIEAHSQVRFGLTRVESLPKSHDAAEPLMFSFMYRGRKVSFITDVGSVCANVIRAVQDADIVFLESNYDELMLRNGMYPIFLKERIAGEKGHLSNVTAAELILEHASSRLSHVFLSHLSENNNTPELAYETFISRLKSRADMGHLLTLITSRHHVSTVVKLPALS